MVSDGNIVVSIKDGVASVVIDGPAAKNAMSFAMIDAEEARSAGFVAKIIEPETLEDAVATLCWEAAHARVTLRTAKEQFRRLARGVRKDQDLLEACYASADFHEGVAAFRAKRAPRWQGM